MANRKGLAVNVYRIPEWGDMSNKGVTSRCSTFVLTWDDMPAECQVFEVTERRPELVLVRRKLMHQQPEYLHARPADETRHTMMGGTFIYSSDSRFRAVSDYPIPVHDRVETPTREDD